MGIMKNMEPEGFWKYFEEICSIPHGSGNTSMISDYLAEWAENHSLEYHQDDKNNVIIIKEATAGCENVEPLIIQGHMDMVCEKEPGNPIDMEREGLTLELDESGAFLKAHGTTLGADDGVALAYGLALLDEENLVHPRLELVFTVDEEIGMLGAETIDLSPLKGTKMVNLDSEEGGIFITSCAGGVLLDASLEFETEIKQGILCSVEFSGFKGGHSGSDIHLGHCNSNRIAARVLYEINKELPLRLLFMEGGTKDNVIPCYTKARILLIGEDQSSGENPGINASIKIDDLFSRFRNLLQTEESKLRHEFRSVDEGITFACSFAYGENENLYRKAVDMKQVLSESSQNKFFHAVLNLPNGVDAMSGEVPGLVETSSNLGILKLENGVLTLGSLLRSMKTEGLHHLMDRFSLFLSECGMKYRFEAEYHGWEYDPDSEIREILVEAYRELFHEEPELMNLHAGLECGVLMKNKTDLDCVSIGPWIHDIHTVKERLDIESVQDYWLLLHKLIEKMAGKAFE